MVANIGSTHLRYHRWAVMQVFAAVEPLAQDKLLADHGVSFGSIYGTLLHIYRADSVWSLRLLGNPHARLSDTRAPDEFHALKEEWTRLLDDLIDWAEKLPESEWLAAVESVNSKGVSSRSPVWRVVLHVVNHATGHLGQVSAILRQIGIVPPNTDLMRFYQSEMPW